MTQNILSANNNKGRDRALLNPKHMTTLETVLIMLMMMLTMVTIKTTFKNKDK